MPFAQQNPDIDKGSYKFVCTFVRRLVQEQYDTQLTIMPSSTISFECTANTE
jgi:hypothetical protein